MLSRSLLLVIFLAISACFPAGAAAQGFSREFTSASGSIIEIINEYGRVEAAADIDAERSDIKSSITVRGDAGVSERDFVLELNGRDKRIEVKPADKKRRIDIIVNTAKGVELKIRTAAGEVRVSGEPAKAQVTTDTGTIAANVPDERLRYELIWTLSKPRIVADFDLPEPKELSRGRFRIKGEQTGEDADDDTAETRLEFTTARGIVLLNVPPGEVADDLRERKLTEAAKALVRSGDSVMIEAIKRVSPKQFGEYTGTLRPIKREPILREKPAQPTEAGEFIKTAIVRVTDAERRSVAGLNADDLTVAENGDPREIIGVKTVDAPFNLVLLLDVSGSIENYVNFIRKAARNFVDTVGPRDRVAIITFNEDVHVLSAFSTDKNALSESLDTFDAGGATALYDALGYTITETLRPLKGERTAIVVLTDGDDNRSFLSFNVLTGAIQESGALIYPLYVPSSLIAASDGDIDADIDPMRTRFMTLTSRSEGEGAKLAEISGGIYYPIMRLTQIQAAYDDIVKQLRTSYAVTFRSKLADTGSGVSPRLHIGTNRPGTRVIINSIGTAEK